MKAPERSSLRIAKKSVKENYADLLSPRIKKCKPEDKKRKRARLSRQIKYLRLLELNYLTNTRKGTSSAYEKDFVLIEEVDDENTCRRSEYNARWVSWLCPLPGKKMLPPVGSKDKIRLLGIPSGSVNVYSILLHVCDGTISFGC